MASRPATAATPCDLHRSGCPSPTPSTCSTGYRGPAPASLNQHQNGEGFQAWNQAIKIISTAFDEGLRGRVESVAPAERRVTRFPTVLGASMMGVRGQVQREGDGIHVIAQRLDDLSGLLARVGNRKDVAEIHRVSRADVVRSPISPDPRRPEEQALGKAARTIYIPDLRLGPGVISGRPSEGITIKPRDFR